VGREPMPAIAVVVSFIDRINRGDVDGLGELMTDDHTLEVLDEEPLVGKASNIEAWRGYVSSFPDYVISPHQLFEVDGLVAVRGHTTGSHLGLPDDEERTLTVIWIARVDRGRLSLWRIEEDTPLRREELGLSR
jgi:ketosteroid isomerase-like protein